MASINVYVLGGETPALFACVKLKLKGYDAHMGAKKVHDRLECVRESQVVLRVTDDGEDAEVNRNVENYARQIHRPVYHSFEQLCHEMPVVKDGTAAKRSRKKH